MKNLQVGPLKEWDITGEHGIGETIRVEIPLEYGASMHLHPEVSKLAGEKYRIHGEKLSSNPGMKIVLMRKDKESS